jgi:hypothetical protein
MITKKSKSESYYYCSKTKASEVCHVKFPVSVFANQKAKKPVKEQCTLSSANLKLKTTLPPATPNAGKRVFPAVLRLTYYFRLQKKPLHHRQN